MYPAKPMSSCFHRLHL